jgi:hypothetical protein
MAREMFAQTFRFDQFQSRMRHAFEPRKPRHRALRVALGLVGLTLLALLVMFGLVVGAAMIVVGVGYRLWKRRGQPIARDPRVIDGEHRVVTKPVLPLSR